MCKTKVSAKLSPQIGGEKENVGNVFSCYQRLGKQIWITAEVNDIKMQYRWDTGSTVSMVSLDGYCQLGSPECIPVNTSLMMYGGKPLDVKGQCLVQVKIGDQVRTNLPLIVVNQKGSNLLGLDWSDHFGLTSLGTSALQSTKSTQTLNTEVQANFLNSVKESKLQHLKKKYYNVFEPKLGKCTKLQVSIHLRDDAPVKPAFSNARPIPFAIRQKVQDELDRLVDLGVLNKVDYSE